jgi:3-hydroxybutyryl-CoA dehydrogenase
VTARVLLTGDQGAAYVGDLARRFRDGGAEVVPWLGDEAPVGQPFTVAIDYGVVDMSAKVRALSLLDATLDATTPLLTCFHARCATLLAAGSRHPERVVGFGLLPPLEGRNLVECARGLRTDEAFVGPVEEIWGVAGLQATWVGDAAGGVLPRIVACLANEALFAVIERTANPEDIDRAMELGTRYPRGPLSWAEQVGLDHILAIMDGLAAEHGEDRYRAAPLLRKMAAARQRAW